MCEGILVKVQCVTVNLLSLFHKNNHNNMPKQLISKFML